MPARGPRSDLCVVVDTTSQCSNGCAASSAATRPLQAFEAAAVSEQAFVPDCQPAAPATGDGLQDSKQSWAVKSWDTPFQSQPHLMCAMSMSR